MIMTVKSDGQEGVLPSDTSLPPVPPAFVRLHQMKPKDADVKDFLEFQQLFYNLNCEVQLADGLLDVPGAPPDQRLVAHERLTHFRPLVKEVRQFLKEWVREHPEEARNMGFGPAPS